MKLTVSVKLQTTTEDSVALVATLERANAAANAISEIAWNQRTFGQFKLQKLCYYAIRERFGLGAEVVIRLLAKVANAYKRDRLRPRVFRKHGSIAYDDRILRYGEDRVSIWTLDGRRSIPFVCDDRARRLLAHRQGESDLIYRDGVFYLSAAINYDEPPEREPEDVIGVDLGIVNIAVDSDGNRHSGRHAAGRRRRHRRLRARTKQLYTRSAKRLFKQRRRKERRFGRHLNHTISKRLVAEAQRTKRAIALEDLKGIRDRVRARKSQRATLRSWSFHELRSFIEYKARMVGVPVLIVDPRNSSRTCPACGHCDKANRVSQDRFSCKQCGLAGLPDFFAALVLRDRGRAAVGLPHADAMGSASAAAGRGLPSALATEPPTVHRPPS